MFNADRKQSFIDSLETKFAKDIAASLFKRSAAYEEEIGKDLCEFGDDELKELSSKYFPKAHNTCSTHAKKVKDYKKWCKEQGFHTEDGVVVLASGMRDLPADTYVSSAGHLKYLLDKVLDSPDANTCDCMYRSFMWFAFMGIPSVSEVLDLKVDNVDLDNQVVRYNNRVYKIPHEAIKDITNVCILDSFVYHHANYTTVIPRKENDNVFRGIKSEKLKKASIGNIFDNFAKHGIHIGFNSLRFSGIFINIREQEHIGNSREMAIKAFAREYVLSSGRSFKTEKQFERAIQDCYREIVFKYESWLKAFP